MARPQRPEQGEKESDVYVPKSLIAAVAIIGAIVFGWMSRDLLSGLTEAVPTAYVTTASVDPQSDSAADSETVGAAPTDSPGTEAVPEAAASRSALTPENGTTNVYLTIVNSPSGGTAMVPRGAPTRAESPDSRQPAVQLADTGMARREPDGRSGGPSERSNRSNGSGRSAPGDPRAADNAQSAVAGSLPQAVLVQLEAALALAAIGDHNIIANAGAIVLVGDDGYLNGNTGDAVEGGTVALDAQSSTFSTNSTSNPPSPAAGTASTNGTSVATNSDAGASYTVPSSDAAKTTALGTNVATTPSTSDAWSPVTTWSGARTSLGGTGGYPWVIPIDASPLVSAFISYTANRTADIAGYEDHSVLTRGMGNVVTYDDSNVFINRDGKINGNTGDTDSAGLNAVAILRSIVRAGPHCDDGCDDESIIQAEAGVFDEGDVAIDGDGHVVWSPDSAGESPNDDDSEDDSLPSDNGDDDDSVDDESDDGDVSDPVEPAETCEEADTTCPVAEHPWGSLIVGGDGIDDLSERVDGIGNVSTYDDSNVIIGGSGDVNAQIGDSDTGGTVAMDVIDSIVEGGTSR
jgi:hypothetical protein